MSINSNILFHLTAGNPDNNPCGIGIDKQIFGQSLGGALMRSATLANAAIVYHQIRNGAQYVFDPVVPSDAINDTTNYRAIFITNYGVASVILNTITCSNIVPDPGVGFPLTDVNIAVEGIYTTAQVSRAIPSLPNQAGNPSLFLKDEYDSTGVLAGLDFKKTLTPTDLPTDIPFDCVLKIWIKRTMAVDELQLPDQSALENFTITVNEYDTGNSTPLQLFWSKIAGRVPLSNWYDAIIPTGNTGKAIVMNELLSKDVDLSTVNILKTFVVNKKVLIFYYVEVNGVNQYFLLVVKPNEITTLNQYVQIMFNFNTDVTGNEVLSNRTFIDIHQSFYDENQFYFFWTDTITTPDPCILQHFGFVDSYTRTSVDVLSTAIWTGDIFDIVLQAYVNRKIETYTLLDHKNIRDFTSLINVEHFEDLFILFAQDSTERGLLNLSNINLNKNELLYLFEKDILAPILPGQPPTYPGIGAQVLSHRLYPQSLPTITEVSSFNNAPSPAIDIIIQDSTQMNPDITSPRTIKFLLDGTRYVDLNSFHGREFKIGNQFVTYELPSTLTDFDTLFFTTSIAITNDAAISTVNPIVQEGFTMTNVIDGVTYPRPMFQQNIIDESGVNSISIPVEWANRNYIDQWVTILSTLPNVVEEEPIFSLQYNFHRNLWQVVYFDSNGVQTTTIYDYLDNQGVITSETSANPFTFSTTGTSGTPGIGKLYTELDIKDLPYVIEPDVYQPFSVRIATRPILSTIGVQKYFVNFQVYFKGNDEPLVDIVTFTTNIANLSYIFVNPDSTLNIRMNYMSILNGENFSKEYYVQNVHASILNKITAVLGAEFLVNPQLHPQQAEFKYYRNINLVGFSLPEEKFEQDGDVTIPVILYGNGYLNTATNPLSQYLGVANSFDFTRLDINDKSLRFYFDGDDRTPLNFKIGYYDYDADFAVIWVRLTDFGIGNRKIYMYYGKADTSDRDVLILESYLALKYNLYPSNTYGAWHFEEIMSNPSLTFNEGRIFNVGEPMIYEKTFDGQLRLTRIDKEYMYGIAKVYKSEFFDIDIDLPAEDSLLLDPQNKTQFINFITNVANLFKPGYTEVNNVQQSGIDVLEAGEIQGMGDTTNTRVNGVVAETPNSNVNTYYSRADATRFDLLTSFNGYSNLIDWVVAKPIDTTLFKSGVLKISGKIKSDTIKFTTPFPDNNYFVFLASPSNQKLFWNLLCPNRFTVTGSFFLSQEVSWMAFHKDIFGGVFTPNSIFCGQRTMTGSVTTEDGASPTVPNLANWYNSQLLIQPGLGVEGDPGVMTIDPVNPGYSLLLSSNENINMFWNTKYTNQFLISTSSPAPCTVHWLTIQNGVDFWSELV